MFGIPLNPVFWDRMDRTVETSLERVRERIAKKTLIQDMSDPLTGSLDRRVIAGKLKNLESAVGDLADAVDAINTKVAQEAVVGE